MVSVFINLRAKRYRRLLKQAADPGQKCTSRHNRGKKSFNEYNLLFINTLFQFGKIYKS